VPSKPKVKKDIRKRVPLALRTAVAKEFNNECATCGEHAGTQIHHIDENPGNNDALNLIPLCPTCHDIHIHGPSSRVTRPMLRLFRAHKDLALLTQNFRSVQERMAFLETPEAYAKAEADELWTLADAMEDLCGFIQLQPKGEYYARRLRKLLRAEEPASALDLKIGVQYYDAEPEERAKEMEAEVIEENLRVVTNLKSVRADVERLVVEFVRFQDWPRRPLGSLHS
jgi:hypothetical protein